MTLERIILEPVVTEKTNVMREAHKYVFKVDSQGEQVPDHGRGAPAVQRPSR